MLFLALVVAGCLLAVVNFSVRSRMGFGGVVVLAGAFFLGVPMLLMVFLPPVAISCLLLALLAIVCWVGHVRLHKFHIGSLGLVVLSFVVVGLFELPKIRRFAEIRQEYPFESLRSRLAYENGHPRLADVPPELSVQSSGKTEAGFLTSAGFLASAGDRLVQMELAIDEDGQARYRSLSLRKFHQSSVQHFIDSAGFGVGRMVRFRGRDPQLPQPSPVPLPMRGPPDREGTPAPRSPSQALADLQTPQPMVRDQLWGLHLTGAAGFVNADGFGYVKSLDAVAGFQSHQFRNMPETPVHQDNEQTARWMINRLQLVSLLKHDEPRVYLTDNLPRMEEIVKAPTRPLSGFERKGLAVLDRGGDLSIDGGPTRIRMIGSLRATQQCLECHNAKRGHLLGALSYELVREWLPRQEPAIHLNLDAF